jgi:hypothetical protein
MVWGGLRGLRWRCGRAGSIAPPPFLPLGQTKGGLVARHAFLQALIGGHRERLRGWPC